MKFRDQNFLTDHIQTTMGFYHPRCIDTEHGGFFHHFRDDGTVYDAATRHLVSSCRFIFNYAMASIHFPDPEYRRAVEHGLVFVEEVHWQPGTRGYAWTLKYREADNKTNHCYGLAFVLLAYASAVKAGVDSARPALYASYELLENRFWLPAHGLYADEASADWSVLAPYRGQNVNMHACEALIAAYEATQDSQFLDRAVQLADQVCNHLSEQAGGLIWEHYDSDWRIDWDYNKSDPKHLFRPWGFQPGHQTEWAKLLVILSRYSDADWLVPRAEALFAKALDAAWDTEFGGICYGFAPDGSICDDDKYFWVQAESFAAAALLAVKTTKPSYWDWYQRIWEYAWEHMVDHRYGAWYRILSRDNRKYDDLKSPAGKTDYHTMGACYEVLRWLPSLTTYPAARGWCS